MSEVFALVSLAGFATQRTLELLDPFFVFLSKLKALALFGDEKAAKTWCMAFAGFGIGLVVALIDHQYKLPIQSETVSDLCIALAISMGSNATNSLVKFGEHVKEARKKQVEPLPEVTLTPTTVTVSPNARIVFLASVSGTDNKAVTWRVLEVSEGGTVTRVDESTGEYTAPGKAGTYHVAAISVANAAATATATILVK